MSRLTQGSRPVKVGRYEVSPTEKEKQMIKSGGPSSTSHSSHRNTISPVSEERPPSEFGGNAVREEKVLDEVLC